MPKSLFLIATTAPWRIHSVDVLSNYCLTVTCTMTAQMVSLIYRYSSLVKKRAFTPRWKMKNCSIRFALNSAYPLGQMAQTLIQHGYMKRLAKINTGVYPSKYCIGYQCSYNLLYQQRFFSWQKPIKPSVEFLPTNWMTSSRKLLTMGIPNWLYSAQILLLIKIWIIGQRYGEPVHMCINSHNMLII